jgi:hypothetical protein
MSDESPISLAETIKAMAAFSTGANPVAMQMKQTAGDKCDPNEVVSSPVQFFLSMILEREGEPLIVVGHMTTDGARAVLHIKDVTNDVAEG